MRAYQRAKETLREIFIDVITLSAAVLIILVVYWQDLLILFNEALQSETIGHIVLIPFIVSYLVYRKKELVKASLVFERFQGETKLVSVGDFVGAAFCLTAFLLYWYSSYTFYPLEGHIASLLIFIMGVTLILANFKTLLILLFPILFLIFLVIPPSGVSYTAGALLANVNTQGSYTLLKTVGLPVSLSSRYGAPIIALNTPASTIEFVVFQASSGVYSLIAFTMFATFLVYITRGPISRRAALLALGFLFLPIFNIIRISSIVSIAYWLGEQIAMDIFHTFTGWLFIIAETLLLLLIAERIFHLQVLQRSRETPHCSECNNSSKTQETFCLGCGKFFKKSRVKISRVFWMKTIALLIGCWLITLSIQAPVFAFAPELIVSSSDPRTNINILPEITNYQFQYLYKDSSYEKLTGADASLVYAYFPQNRSTPPVYIVIGVARSLSSIHNWEISLFAWRTAQGLPIFSTLLNSGEVQLSENPPIIARYLVFERPSDYTYVALYWYQRAMFNTGLTVDSRYVRINLLILTTSPEKASELLEELQTIGHSIIDHWEPLRTQTLVSVGVPLQQFLLGSFVVTAVIAQASRYVLERKKKNTNQRIVEIAPTNEKLLLQTIKETGQKTKETTTQTIASAFEKALGHPVKKSELNHMLHNLEKAGIIRLNIENLGDQPRLVWKI